MITQSCLTPISENLFNFIELITETNEFDSFEVVNLTSANIADYQKIIKKSLISFQPERYRTTHSDLDNQVNEQYAYIESILPISMLLFKQKYSSTARYFTTFFEEDESVVSIQPLKLSLFNDSPVEFYLRIHGERILPSNRKMGYDSSVVNQVFSSTSYLLPFNKEDSVIGWFGDYHSKATAKLFEVEVRIFEGRKNHFPKLNILSEEDMAELKRSCHFNDNIKIMNTRFFYNNSLILDEYDVILKHESNILDHYISMFLTNAVKKHKMSLDIQPAPTKEYCDYFKEANLHKVIEMIKC